MLLATTTIEDFDAWMKVFTTTSAEKRRRYGSKGAAIFRDHEIPAHVARDSPLRRRS